MSIKIDAPTIQFPRFNNLEWLRLIFATQVVIAHVAKYMGIAIPKIIDNFPGVPAFFFVSGFLIYSSYLNAPGLRYIENRFLRLFPGLFFVTVGGMLVAITAHGWNDISNNFHTYIIWFIAQITLGQAYNPSLFRDIGVGVINGSLWTLTVEILFYICVPIIVFLENKFRYSIYLLLALSFAMYAIGPHIWTDPIYRYKTIYDVIELTPVAWGWMFASGILAAKHFDLLFKWAKYLPYLLIPLTIMIIFGNGPLFGSKGNHLGLFYFICYAGLVFWLAFKTRYINLKTDLSYGIYIWHTPIINLMLVLAIPNLFIVIILTFLIALLSWFLIEKPSLKLKHQSLKPTN
jgi:peptidoglycan/LPS O-acetylase OafA/YrhL